MVVAAADELPRLLIELGVVIVALALLARVSNRFALSPIPLYLLAGLAVGEPGPVHIDVSHAFVSTAAEIGVVMLLLALGLQFTAEELQAGLRSGLPAGIFDAVANFTPGVAAGLFLGWGTVGALLLGGVTYISSSGIISKLLGDLGRLSNRETPVILTVLVFEDLVMAVFLPVVAVLATGAALSGSGLVKTFGSLGAVALALFVALRHGQRVSRVVQHRSDEVLLLSLVGLTCLVAGIAEGVGASAAIGAFLVGIAIADPVAERAEGLVGPLRDLFAALFFFLFGLQVNAADLVPVVGPAVTLAAVTVGTKVLTGWWAARRAGVGARGRLRAGTALVARGEFSIVIAEIGVAAGVAAGLGPLAAAYVLVLAVVGPVLARFYPPERTRRRVPASAG